MTAILSQCGEYRYRLERTIDASLPAAALIMVNPSKATATEDDPTIRKAVGFWTRLGYGRLIVGNLFAFRATDVSELRKAKDPVGPENDAHLRAIMHDATIVFVGWGAISKVPQVHRDRWKAIVRMADEANIVLHCIGTNADQHPKHPLMTGYDTPAAPWKAPWFAGRRAAA